MHYFNQKGLVNLKQSQGKVWVQNAINFKWHISQANIKSRVLHWISKHYKHTSKKVNIRNFLYNPTVWTCERFWAEHGRKITLLHFFVKIYVEPAVFLINVKLVHSWCLLYFNYKLPSSHLCKRLIYLLANSEVTNFKHCKYDQEIFLHDDFQSKEISNEQLRSE